MLKPPVSWDSEVVNSDNNGNINAEKSCLTSAVSLLISQLLWDFTRRFGVSSSLVRCFVFAARVRGEKRQSKGLLMFEIVSVL